MVQSINTRIDLVMESTAFTGLTDYGKVMIGDKGFEFYHDRDPRKFIQIPWDEVDYVLASVMFKGKWIPRYAIQTKKNGTYSFSSRKPKELLRAIQPYVPAERMVQSLGFFDVIKRAYQSKFGKNKNSSN